MILMYFEVFSHIFPTLPNASQLFGAYHWSSLYFAHHCLICLVWLRPTWLDVLRPPWPVIVRPSMPRICWSLCSPWRDHPLHHNWSPLNATWQQHRADHYNLRSSSDPQWSSMIGIRSMTIFIMPVMLFVPRSTMKVSSSLPSLKQGLLRWSRSCWLVTSDFDPKVPMRYNEIQWDLIRLISFRH